MRKSKKIVSFGYFSGNFLNSLCMLLIIPTFTKYVENYDLIGNGFIIGQLCALIAGYSFSITIPRLYKGEIIESIKGQVVAYQLLILLVFVLLSSLFYWFETSGGDLMLLLFPVILLMSQGLILQWYHIYLPVSYVQIGLLLVGRFLAIVFCILLMFNIIYIDVTVYISILIGLFYLPVLPTLKNFKFENVFKVYEILPLLYEGVGVFKLTLLSSIYLVLPSILISYFNVDELAQYQQFDRIRLMIGNFSGVILGILYSYKVANNSILDVYKYALRISLVSLSAFLFAVIAVFVFASFDIIKYILEALLLDLNTLVLALLASFLGSTTNIFVTLGMFIKGKEKEYFSELILCASVFIMVVLLLIIFNLIDKNNVMLLVCFVEFILFLKVYLRVSKSSI